MRIVLLITKPTRMRKFRRREIMATGDRNTSEHATNNQ
jgi:hypothetical protein